MFFIKTRCKSTIFLQTSKINYILFFFSKKEEKSFYHLKLPKKYLFKINKDSQVFFVLL